MKPIVDVPSLTKDGVRWPILDVGGGAACACPSFDYSPEPKTCKHMAIFAAARHAADRCRKLHRAGRRSGDGVCLQCLVDVLAFATRKVRTQYAPKTAKVVDIKSKSKRRTGR